MPITFSFPYLRGGILDHRIPSNHPCQGTVYDNGIKSTQRVGLHNPLIHHADRMVAETNFLPWSIKLCREMWSKQCFLLFLCHRLIGTVSLDHISIIYECIFYFHTGMLRSNQTKVTFLTSNSKKKLSSNLPISVNTESFMITFRK